MASATTVSAETELPVNTVKAGLMAVLETVALTVPLAGAVHENQME